MLEKLLGSKLRTKLLGWIFLHTDERFFTRQLAGLLKEDSTNISRELARLSEMGVLESQTEGRQKYYSVNRECPVFPELQSLFIKTAGLSDVLKKSFEPLSDKIHLAFVFGSMAEGSIDNESDVDLMLIGSISLAEVTEALDDAQGSIGREINPHVFSKREWRERFKDGDHFINSLMGAKKIFLIGSEDELEQLTK